MSSMELRTAEPRRHPDTTSGAQQGYRVPVPTRDPFLDDGVPVSTQRGFVAFPHEGCWVITPAASFGEGFEELVALVSLVPQTTPVEYRCGLFEVRIRQKGLHEIKGSGSSEGERLPHY